MSKLVRRSLTYANVTATLALVLAMAGGAVAANHYLINSTKQINPNVLHSLKGAHGQKGVAGVAGAQGLPGPAGATGTPGLKGIRGTEGLTGAPGAPGEPGIQGEKGERGEIGPSGGEKGEDGEKGERGEKGEQGNAGGPAAHWRKTIAKAGKTKATTATVTLETVGPFTISGHCYEEEGSTIAATYISTSEAGSFAAESEEGEEVPLKVGEQALISTEPAEGETEETEAKFKGPYGGLFAAESKGGTFALDGAANEGVFLGGTAEPACYFSGFVVSE
jgi:hypothetical protein